MRKPCILIDISLVKQVRSLDIVAEMLGDLELTHIFKSTTSKFLFKINQRLESKTFAEFLQLSRESECGSKYYLYAEVPRTQNFPTLWKFRSFIFFEIFDVILERVHASR